MYKTQRSILFKPEGDMQHPDHHGLGSVDEIIIETSDGTDIVCWYQPPPDKNGSLLLYFHGNALHIGDEWRVKKFQSFLNQNMGIAVISYRGYGKSNGHASEEGIYIDARSTIDYLINHKKHALKQLILYGESLGTGIAVQMALEYPAIKAMILEAPYTSIEQKGIELYPWLPVSILIKDRFDSITKAPNIIPPSLIIHGAQDQTIPMSHGQSMLEALGAKKKHGLFPEKYDHTNFDPDYLSQNVVEFCAKT